MHLEFPPQFVHVAFSETIATKKINVLNRNVILDGGAYDDMDLNSESYQDVANMDPDSGRASEPVYKEEIIVKESLFGILGENGNNLMIYSSDSIILKHQI